jgi:predicted small metal-binding protein
MAVSTRKYVDCSEYPSDQNCTLKISGSEEEVLTAAAQHAVASHGHQDGPELREMLRKGMHDEA